MFKLFQKTMDEFNEFIDVINFVHSIKDLNNKVAYLLEKDDTNTRSREQHNSIINQSPDKPEDEKEESKINNRHFEVMNKLIQDFKGKTSSNEENSK